MKIYALYFIIFFLGVCFGILVMAIQLKLKSSKLKMYKRKLEKESINSDESFSKVKVLEAKIVVLEKALENALKK